METKVIIERGTDGLFSCFVEDDSVLKNGVNGFGNTAEEAKQDFLQAYAEAVEEFDENKGLTFTFAYDTASFLQYFGKKFSLAGLQEITGINRKQLSHYLNGNSKPSKATIKKIELGVQHFQQELHDISFV